MKKALLLLTILCTSLITYSQTTYTVNTIDDFLDVNLNDAICADKNGNCTFRAALQNANKTSNKDIVNFNISGSAPFTIAITEDILPDILQPVIIDGRTQPQYTINHTPVIEISNTFLQYSNGIKLIGNSSGSELYGLCVVNFARMTQYPYSFGYGIISSTANHIIQSNYIGLRADGKTVGGNTGGGLSLGYLGGHLVGGTQPFQGNVISGNPSFGLNISGSSLNSFQSSNNIIQGNLIGTDATGTLNRGNKFNVQIVDSYNNTLGGHTPQARNVISGANATDDATVGTGIAISGTQSYNNAIIGNYIGTDITGTKSIPNARGGVLILFGANTNRIGTDGSGEGNIISGNGQYGVYLQGGTTDPVISNLIRGNYIGVDATGNVALPNSIGIMMLTGENNNNIIGGTTANSKNVISGNASDGITILSGKNNQIIGNYIGTNALGTLAIPNYTGIYLEDSNNSIGGQAAGNRNIISGNSIGIEISESTSSGSSIIGNYIGLNASGNRALPNATGISLHSSSTNSTIGGANPLDKNIISGNSNIGIFVSGTSHNIQNNYIGLNSDGNGIIKNGNEGLRLNGTLTNTKVSENTISGNGTTSNTSKNVYFNSANEVHFFRNKVGTLPDGNSLLTNIGVGLTMNNSNNNSIGGTTVAEGNIIGNHNLNGILLISNSNNNTFSNNNIGVGSDGSTNIGNSINGIVITGNNTKNKVSNNTITNNQNGVIISTTSGVPTQVTISKNSIYNNSVLGIDLEGTASNDVNDADTGANILQNSPEISAINYLGNVSVEVTYNVPSAVTNSAYPITVEFFGADNGQGKKYISTDIYTLPGAKTVTLSLPNGFEQNDYNNIVGTATDENGNTSEFGTSVNYSLGISKFENNTAKIFPNPTRDLLTIQSNFNETLTIEVFDVYGKNVMNQKMINTMNVSSLASGVYLLKIKDENGGIKSAKMIKQ
ncbi:T9SS type A sorting domain-containing protein [Aureibaculum luteum]|uniref:T9SS type A sorting domain-containing protein n=1 Tax=Aureibaculum luteum TaxID=1548456 RepID=UPI000E52D78F|nr:T9SS type A sorting domain-containing protein [Aureibaculum luteum]